MATSHTVCPLDCPDRCSLEVTVDQGRVVALDGSRVNPVTDGFICSKVRRYPERLYGPDRLLHPMRRTGAKGEGRFERISWDQALGEIADRLGRIRGEHGGEAILPFAYGGSNGLVSQGSADEWLFRRLAASRLERTVCAAQTGCVAEAIYGKMASTDFPDFEKARVILLWGGNPKHSNIHLMPFLKRARAAGARIALVDPRRILGSEWVDWHLPLRPGTDVAVALAMIGHIVRIGRVDRAFLSANATGSERLLEEAARWSLERAAGVSGVPARDIATVAEAYAEAEPALVRCGWGLERNRNGEAAVAAVLALPAVAGKFGRAGGGYALSSSEAYQVNGDHLAGAPAAATRPINMSRLGRVLLEEQPPVRALFVYDANPVVTLPDQERVRRGLLREDLFTVVYDQVKTDTALFADIVLPATTFLESSEIATSYGTYAVMLAEPVIAPVGEARPNAAVFRDLALRMGVEPPPAEDALVERALESIEAKLAGESGQASATERLARLRREKVLRFDFPGERPVQFVTVFPGTADRRIQLWPAALGDAPYRYQPDPGDAAHPLALISPSTEKSICSTLGEFMFREAWVELHPADAASRGLSAGQVVRVHNQLGEVQVPLRLSDAMRPGVAYLPKGIWNRHTRNGRAGNALVPDWVSPISGGACFNDARVEVSAL